MFVCAADDGEAPRRAGCLCHTPAFARLNAHLAQKFSRLRPSPPQALRSAHFAAGSGSTPAGASAGPGSRVAFTNVRLFDGKSDALLAGLRVVVEGKTIKAVEPAEAPLDADVRVIDCGGRVLMPGLIDAHWHAMLASLPLTGLADGGCRLHHSGRGGRSEKDAACAASPASGTWPAPTFGLKRAIDQGLVPGPRIWPSGAMISQTGGHGDFRFPMKFPPPECAAEPGRRDRRRRHRRRRRSRAPARS